MATGLRTECSAMDTGPDLSGAPYTCGRAARRGGLDQRPRLSIYDRC